MTKDDSVPTAEDLLLTFGYAGSLAEHPPYSRFDVRDEVCLSVGGFLHGQSVRDRNGKELVVVGVKAVEGTPRLWFHPRDLGRPGAGAFPDDSVASLKEKLTPVGPFSRAAREARAKLSDSAPAPRCAKKGGRQLCEQCPEEFNVAEDADGEEVLLCCQCGLPIGDFAYMKDDKEEALVHADCMAQLIQQDFGKEVQDRQQKGAELKAAHRADYDIGWKPDMIPLNLGPAKKLKCNAMGRGMCCLRFQENSDSLCLAPTTDPAGSINLEYLSLALQVRFKEGTEPRFSLDPIDPSRRFRDAKDTMQMKRFEPEWLAATSAGDVLFQADYHLKELSMGEHEQPVVGMRSCLDYSEDDQTNEWRAREWFIVRNAEVQVSEESVLIPQVKMGVEAREQRMTPYGLEDAKITRPDHPLVKYAEDFTHNFDLIAERKSVIYHLRELAKASVLAKYLLEAGVSLEEFWFDLAEKKGCCCMEVPQLWNERSHSTVQVQDGQILDRQQGVSKGTHSLYGGVSFGLDIFKIYSSHERQVQGVDLNLDRFNLNQPTPLAQKIAGSGDSFAAGGAFWRSLAARAGSRLPAEERSLLQAVFNPCLSDRRDEAERFVPPVACPAYLQALRSLVKEEELLRQRRVEHFLSSKFATDDAGPLFPASWAPPLQISHGQPQAEAPEAHRAGGLLRARPDYVARRAQELACAMQSAVPVFDRRTEDGVRFRVYRLGSLEVRTTQELEGEETIGMVFSVRSENQDAAEGRENQIVGEQERIVKATEYVEKPSQAPALSPMDCCSYAVLETESGHLLVTERLADGKVTWSENPADLEDRNSLAKVVRSEDCRNADVSVQRLKECRAREARGNSSASAFARRRYTQVVYSLACGRENDVECGFRRQVRGKWWLSGSGIRLALSEKSKRSAKDYADKTYTIKFSAKGAPQRYSKDQYKELKETLTFLMGARKASAAGGQDYESPFARAR